MNRAILPAKAREMAAHAHRANRYNDGPYTDHLDHTVAILERFGITDPEVIAAGYLHDAPEDTELTVPRIAAALTPRIAHLVDAVTDGPGKNRRERKARPLAMIPTCHGALELKLADRIANIEAALANSNDTIAQMYAKEFATLTRALRPKGTREPKHLKRMWEYLERLLKGIH